MEMGEFMVTSIEMKKKHDHPGDDMGGDDKKTVTYTGYITGDNMTGYSVSHMDVFGNLFPAVDIAMDASTAMIYEWLHDTSMDGEMMMGDEKAMDGDKTMGEDMSGDKMDGEMAMGDDDMMMAGEQMMMDGEAMMMDGEKMMMEGETMMMDGEMAMDGEKMKMDGEAMMMEGEKMMMEGEKMMGGKSMYAYATLTGMMVDGKLCVMTIKAVHAPVHPPAMGTNATLYGYLYDHECMNSTDGIALDGTNVSYGAMDHMVACLLLDVCIESGYILVEKDTTGLFHPTVYFTNTSTPTIVEWLETMEPGTTHLEVKVRVGAGSVGGVSGWEGAGREGEGGCCNGSWGREAIFPLPMQLTCTLKRSAPTP
jgi:hypothetical protein